METRSTKMKDTSELNMAGISTSRCYYHYSYLSSWAEISNGISAGRYQTNMLCFVTKETENTFSSRSQNIYRKMNKETGSYI